MSRLVCDRNVCQQVADIYAPILLELVGRAVAKFNENKQEQDQLEKIYAWTSLLINHPYLLETCEQSIIDSKEYLSAESVNLTESTRLSMILETFYNLLRIDANVFYSFVNWDLIITISSSENKDQRFYAIGCLLLALNYNDWSSLVDDQFAKNIGDIFGNHGLARSSVPMHESASLVNDHINDKENLSFTSSDIQTNLRAMSDILVPVKNGALKHRASSFVLTSSALAALHGMVISLTTGTPILLEGELGTGKTALLEYFAAMIGRLQAPDILKLQLGDQTDSKVRLL